MGLSLSTSSWVPFRMFILLRDMWMGQIVKCQHRQEKLSMLLLMNVHVSGSILICTHISLFLFLAPNHGNPPINSSLMQFIITNDFDHHTSSIPCNVTMAHAVDCCLFPTGSVEDRSHGPVRPVLSHYHIPKKRLGGNRDHFPGSISNTLAAEKKLNTQKVLTKNCLMFGHVFAIFANVSCLYCLSYGNWR
jgi:hypothetical protein